MLPPTSKFSLIITTLLLALCPLAYGQQAEDLVNRKLKLLAWDSHITGLEMQQADAPLSIVIPNGAPSEQIDYRGTPIIRFGTTEVDNEGKEFFVTQASTALPETKTPIVLLFFAAEKDRYKIIPIAEPTSEPEKNTFRIINITPERFFLKLGEERVEVLKGKDAIVKPADRRGESITVLMAKEAQGEIERVYSARWARMPEKQVTVFLLQDPKSGRFSVKRYIQ